MPTSKTKNSKPAPEGQPETKVVPKTTIQKEVDPTLSAEVDPLTPAQSVEQTVKAGGKTVTFRIEHK